MRFTEAEEHHILERANVAALLRPVDIVDLRNAYHEPHRHYHNWHHALSVLAWCNHVVDEMAIASGEARRALVFAALYHDAVYAVGAKDNEERSVEMMRSAVPSSLAAELINATAQHGKLETGDVSELTAIFLDCDIATFGEPRWEVAKWHNEQVERELLQIYTAEQVAEGRTKFLGGLLAKRSVFLSDYFRTRYEAQARANIARLMEGRA